MTAYVPLTDFELEEYDLELASFQSEAGNAVDYEMERRMLREVTWQRKTVRALLRAVGGEPSPCRGCDAPVYWLKLESGRRAPYTPLGLNHFSDCPAADRFRKANL